MDDLHLRDEPDPDKRWTLALTALSEIALRDGYKQVASVLYIMAVALKEGYDLSTSGDAGRAVASVIRKRRSANP